MALRLGRDGLVLSEMRVRRRLVQIVRVALHSETRRERVPRGYRRRRTPRTLFELKRDGDCREIRCPQKSRPERASRGKYRASGSVRGGKTSSESRRFDTRRYRTPRCRSSSRKRDEGCNRTRSSPVARRQISLRRRKETTTGTVVEYRPRPPPRRPLRKLRRKQRPRITPYSPDTIRRNERKLEPSHALPELSLSSRMGRPRPSRPCSSRIGNCRCAWLPVV